MKGVGQRRLEVGTVTGFEPVTVPVVIEFNGAVDHKDEFLAVVGDRHAGFGVRIETEQERFHEVSGGARPGQRGVGVALFGIALHAGERFTRATDGQRIGDRSAAVQQAGHL